MEEAQDKAPKVSQDFRKMLEDKSAVYIARVFNMMQHSARKKPAVESAPVPQGFDYAVWCGPAPMAPYDPIRRWLDRWEYS